MSEPQRFDCPDQGQSQIEAMIRAARHYVRPSDDLRPKILDVAREHCGDRRAEQKLGSFALAALILMLFCSPAIRYAELLQSKVATHSANEVQNRAAELATHREIGSHWALAEAFSQLRHLQASRLGHSTQRMK